ncbi:MAG: tetratricopeptide repeat protein [Kiloniellaceae bacterium]
MTRLILGAAFLFGLTASAWAGLPGTSADGAGVDPAAAFRHWLQHAVRGNAVAQFELGKAYAGGRSLPEDLAEAARWFHKAAVQGHVRAQYNLAILYRNGLGVRRNDVRAHVWFSLAAAGFGYGLRHDRAARMRDHIAAHLSPAERAKAERLVRTMTLMFDAGF